MSFFRDIIIRLFVIPVILVSVTPCASFSATGVKTSFKKYSLFTYNDRVYLCEPYLVRKDEWLYKIFRQKGEISASDFPLFLKIFKNINPKIGNIDAITPGSRILIPLKQVDKNAYEQGSKGDCGGTGSGVLHTNYTSHHIPAHTQTRGQSRRYGIYITLQRIFNIPGQCIQGGVKKRCFT